MKPIAARGSIGVPVTRLIQVSKWTTCAGAGEGGIGLRLVADLAIDRDIVAAVVPHRSRARLHRIGGAHDRRQRLVIDLDQLGRVLRLIERLGDHHRHRLADKVHRLVGHRQMPRDDRPCNRASASDRRRAGRYKRRHAGSACARRRPNRRR